MKIREWKYIIYWKTRANNNNNNFKAWFKMIEWEISEAFRKFGPQTTPQVRMFHIQVNLKF